VPEETDGLFPVVGIGASAGGLDAFTSLVSALTDDTGMAFVAVPHLDPTHPSALAAILARSTSMPVVEIVDGQAIAPNTVYVLPPGQDLTIEETTLELQPRSVGALHHPIDLFFRSLAEARRHQAIGVVLSGTATDGTLGVRAIKGAGGITFAQDDSARQTSMPHSAIAGGFVDFVLSPDAIGAELVRIGRSPRTLEDASVPPVDEHAQVAEILQIVRRDTGVDFTNYKAGTLRRRILRRMILHRIDHLQDYEEILRARAEEARALHDDLLIGVTSFFRDPDSFEALTRKAFQRVLDAAHDGEPIRVWVLGCSTGEEAYSLAIALTEFVEAAGRSVPLQIFASDVNAVGIEVARSATYPADIAQDVSPERLGRFFVKIDDHYRVIKSIRDACVFSRHNVLTDPPFSRIDLVSCRNLLMYLEPVLQRDVVRNLHYALKQDGVLWLGLADTVSGHPDLFDTLDVQHKIFGRRPGSVSHPVLRALTARLRRLGGAASDPTVEAGTVDVLKESDRVLLHRFAPAGVVVSSSMEILQYRGNVGRYVSPSPGKASLGLMPLLDRRLHVAVRAVVARAQREGVAVRDHNARLGSDDGNSERAVSIEVVPLGAPPNGFLILFDEAESPLAAASAQPVTAATEPSTLERVTKELADTQAYLQVLLEEHDAAREDLEAAHGEAQSANEELQSINEELETSKEEIQSANEELTTLNEELQHRNSELQLTNNDLVNLLASTDLAVVFVGPALDIRRFTNAAGRLLNLRPADRGRPLSELRVNLDVDVHAQVAHTLQTLETSEQRVQNADGRWFALRTRPYRTLDNQIDGVVLVLVDIDEIVRARLYAESIIATVRAPLIVLDERFEVVTANEAFLRAFSTSAQKIEGQPFFELAGRQWRNPGFRQLLERVLPQNDVVKDFQMTADTDSGSRIFLLDARRLQQTVADRPLILISMEDVSERQHVERLRQHRVTELAAADQSKNEFLAMLAHELRNPLAAIRTAAQMLGTPGVPPRAVSNARVIIERQIRNMVRLIDDLLDVARITQGKLTLQLAPVELTSLLRRSIEVVERHIEERNQKLSIAFETEPIYVLGDTTRLEQAFGNLVNNASKFSKKSGHIDVRARVEPGAHGAEVVVHIKDTGIGIDPSTLPHVFDLFRQGAAASPHHASGLGVGLALVRRIAELHGGRVNVSSAGADQGSEFVVSLPVLATADTELTQHAEQIASTTEAQRILVVDDNTDAAESLTDLLRVYGHDARMVHDGIAALELVPSFLPSVVFLDIGMPGIDGYEVARRLRRLPGGEHVLLIAVTGFGREEDRRLSEEAGFDRHVTKPLNPRTLPSLISRDGGGEASD
jgi:two-component system CheB/CheR fusion protein